MSKFMHSTPPSTLANTWGVDAGICGDVLSMDGTSGKEVLGEDGQVLAYAI